MNNHFWSNKRVLLTGHTGFKGTWAALWLKHMGAQVTGIALPAETPFFDLLHTADFIDSHLIDINDRAALSNFLAGKQFDIVLHMAAQSLVRRSYRSPVETFATNLMGTLHLLEAVQQHCAPKVIQVITSDKVYQNHDHSDPFAETAPLGGDDPYSASKACAEIAVHSWRKSGLAGDAKLVTVRAGNVVGGGDWSEDRLIPDFIRAWVSQAALELRFPESTRPWQHVLDVLNGYFIYAQSLYENEKTYPNNLNFGPAVEACIPAKDLIAKMQTYLGAETQISTNSQVVHLPEKSRLSIDASLAASTLNWSPKLSIDQTLAWTANWYQAWHQGQEMHAFSIQQISQHQAL